MSPNTIQDRIGDISNDLEGQLHRTSAELTHFAIAMDDSTDKSDTAQLAVFIRGVDKDMNIVEEFLDLYPMKGQTRGKDLLNALIAIIEKFNLSWDRNVLGFGKRGGGLCGHLDRRFHVELMHLLYIQCRCTAITSM